ncbi:MULTISPECIES: ATP-binding protein [unclassified Streptomyces]|uniref:ATP-binding protein n=1 Tax=unclassified Streptomyces TaxID=2593676 RepID=UPI002DDABA80|nr:MULTISPECIES: ATP-binding protein [unclassified Streptomyces]WSF81732.1 ATP-binding protein [Streptomyces sp. NBC_01744]WSC34101.1 ATP-binding protein [Streptomyces sp. NBC_01763]WSC41957.1 ATP-binding protein [Streptomyces sp. NBC_01763]WSC50899.1 ATP-binding protein [Streptomyces sp. NBC_01761]WSC58622.1 ATP-binding protein [Streptomyces sp. NBC_01761]
MPSEEAAFSIRDRVFGKGALAPGHRPELHTTQHAVMVRRALQGFYRRMALSRLVVVPLWTGTLTAEVLTSPTSRPQSSTRLLVTLVLMTGALSALGAVAAWSHHHEGALNWMGARRALRHFSGYLRRTARDRRVSVDVPGLTEGAGVLAMASLTAWTAPEAQQAAPVLWSVAFTLLLLYFPFSQYVIDPSWYQPDLARRGDHAWFRFLLPLALAGAGFALYRVCAPASAPGPAGAIVIVGLMLRLYVDVSLVNALLSALPDALRDQRKDLSDAVSSVVHSKIKNELRILGTYLELDSQSPVVQASWHSLVHQVETLRCHPFREGDRLDLDEIVEGVRSTSRAHAADSSAIELSAETAGADGAPLRPTDLNLLELILSDLCANSVREANRLGRSTYGIRISISMAEEGRRHRVTVTVEDDGGGFNGALSMNRQGSSLAVLDRRLKRRGGGIEVSRAPGGGARVRATWLAL